jgi:hypothetical protein
MKLLDDDGENQAVRWFLACYGGGGSKTIGAMRAHLEMSGFEGCWPEWCDAAHPSTHLTKGGAQQWIRHLFSLEAQQVAEPATRAQQWHFAWRELEEAYSQGRYDESMSQGPSVAEYAAMEAQQVAVPCKGKNCGSTNHKLHSAECFAEYERAIGQPQVAQVSQGYYCVACETHVSGACNSIDCPISDEAPPPQPEAQQVAVPAPDMFWNHDDADKLYSSISEFLNDEMCNGTDIAVGDIRTVQRAARLPNIDIRITSVNDDECDADYEIVEAQGAKT